MKKRISPEWTRWQQQWDQGRKQVNGSSQVRDRGFSGEASPEVIAEAIMMEVHHKVFSDQPDKREVSRHIANVVTPIVIHYAVHQKVRYYEWLTGDWHQWREMYHAAVKKNACFKEKYGELWKRAMTVCGARVESRRVWWKEHDEALKAAIRAEHDRLRTLSDVQTSHPEDQAGGGS